MSIDLFREAVKAAYKGQEKTAIELLRELLLGHPRHELGWLWLSKLSDDLDEKISALETALSLNPERRETKLKLEELRHQKANQYALPPQDLYQEAIQAYKNGRSHSARQILEHLIKENPKHEKAWLGLARVCIKPEEKIVALEVALDLNPDNAKAQAYLQKLKLNQEDKLALGLAYENFGEYGRAMAAFKYAAKNSISSTDRHIAQKHYQALNEQAEKIKQAAEPKKPIKVTSANATLIRLALGPFIIYCLILLIHGGLNPLKIPLSLLLGTFAVVTGSLLTVGTANTPHHPFWQKILGPEGIKDNPTRSIMTGLGLLLILIPFGIVFVSGITRIAQLRAHLPDFIN